MIPFSTFWTRSSKLSPPKLLNLVLICRSLQELKLFFGPFFNTNKSLILPVADDIQNWFSGKYSNFQTDRDYPLVAEKELQPRFPGHGFAGCIQQWSPAAPESGQHLFGCR